MKKLVILTALLSAVAFGKVLEGTSEGYGGTMKVQVTMDGDKIAKVEVIENNDTRNFFRRALPLTEILVGKTSTDGIEAMAGASYSSSGILNGVKDALSKQ